MKIVKHTDLIKFYEEHKDAKAPLEDWFGVARGATWRCWADVRATASNGADQVGRYTVFNIGGNKYRLITHIRYDWGKVFIKAVLTHKEYDQDDWKDDS